MSIAIFDAREGQNQFDLHTGQKRYDDYPQIRMVKEVVREHPFPDDAVQLGNQWVTDTALDLAMRYQPRFAFLMYSQKHYLRLAAQDKARREQLIASVFSEAQRFAKESGFFPVIVGTGDMVSVKNYINLCGLDGCAVASHSRYAGLSNLSARDIDYLQQLPGIQRLVSRAEFMALFYDIPINADRLPDYLAVAMEGYSFKATLVPRTVMIPSANYAIPVAGLGDIEAITDIRSRVDALLQGKKVALIIIEGVGVKDFRLPYTACSNRKEWYVYENGVAQYLTISTGRHQALAYPPGYNYHQDQTKGYPFSSYFTSLPIGTIGQQFGGKSIAVGNRSIFMHTVTGTDVAIECFADSLANQRCMGVIHR